MTAGAAHAVHQPPLWHLANHPFSVSLQNRSSTHILPHNCGGAYSSDAILLPSAAFKIRLEIIVTVKLVAFFSWQQVRPVQQRNYIKAEVIALESCIRTIDMRPAIKRALGRERMKRVPYVMSQTNVEWLRYEQRGQQLLPGIPNEITLFHITPKLPWTAFGSLSSVSYIWREAIQSRQVSHARGCSQSKENFALIKHRELSPNYPFSSGRWIALYSLREKRIYRLPGIPRVASGIPHLSKCILFDDKVYVLGGLVGQHNRTASRSMYVMDLAAGQKHWERCASMKSGRVFERWGKKMERYCRIRDGNIIVYEAFDQWWLTPDKEWLTPTHAEIYYPKLDVWSPIKYYPKLDLWADNESQLALGQGQRWADDPDLHPTGNDVDEYLRRISILNAYISELCDRDEWKWTSPETQLYLRGPQGTIHSIEYVGKARL